MNARCKRRKRGEERRGKEKKKKKGKEVGCWIHGVEHDTEGNISEACNERTKHIGSAH